MYDISKMLIKWQLPTGFTEFVMNFEMVIHIIE